MSRVISLNFSANRKIRKPFHYEIERGFLRLSARCFADIIGKKKQDEINRVSEFEGRQRSLFLASNFKPKKTLLFKQ